MEENFCAIFGICCPDCGGYNLEICATTTKYGAGNRVAVECKDCGFFNEIPMVKSVSFQYFEDKNKEE